jgi:hypothetical protein
MCNAGADKVAASFPIVSRANSSVSRRMFTAKHSVLCQIFWREYCVSGGVLGLKPNAPQGAGKNTKHATSQARQRALVQIGPPQREAIHPKFLPSTPQPSELTKTNTASLACHRRGRGFESQSSPPLNSRHRFREREGLTDRSSCRKLALSGTLHCLTGPT